MTDLIGFAALAVQVLNHHWSLNYRHVYSIIYACLYIYYAYTMYIIFYNMYYII